MRRALAVMVLASMAACAVGPDYRRPDDHAPAGFVDAARATQPEWLDAWWRQFDDPLLGELVERGARANLDVSQALARLRQARAEANAAAGAYYPNLSLDASAVRSRMSENGLVPLGRIPGVAFTNTLYRAEFDASWELDLFGHSRRTVEAANARRAGADAAARNGLLTVAAEIAAEYVGYRFAQQQLAVVDDNIRITEETAQLVTQRRDVGDASDLDVNRARSAMHTARAQRPTVLAEQRASQHRLEVLLGEQPGALDTLLAEPRQVPQSALTLPIDLPSSVLRRRPDVAQAESDLAAATANIGVAVAEQFPRFSLVGTLGQEAISGSEFTAEASRIWSLGPQLTLPIFQGGRLASQVQAREAARDAALAAYRKAVLAALADTETALVRDQRERERAVDLDSALSTADQALIQVQRRYAVGDVAITDVLDAQRTRNEARAAQIESIATVARNRIALWKSLGGGWQSLEGG